MWKKLRQEAGLTQTEFAEKTRYSQARISQYESGYRTMPKKHTRPIKLHR